ncbi:MAG: hypothetical protein R3B95_20215 [Nitrospirales bacterium]|nr:hypothetical protein [Nitrospirales bacterium]
MADRVWFLSGSRGHFVSEKGPKTICVEHFQQLDGVSPFDHPNGGEVIAKRKGVVVMRGLKEAWKMKLFSLIFSILCCYGCAYIELRTGFDIQSEEVLSGWKLRDGLLTLSDPYKIVLYNGCNDVKLLALGLFPFPIIPWPPGLYSFFFMTMKKG